MDELLKIIKDGGGGDGGSSSGASASHPPVAAAAEAAGKARNANPEAMASMRGHAERLWKYLDNLAEESPEAYDKFVKEQAAAAGVDFEGGSGTVDRAEFMFDLPTDRKFHPGDAFLEVDLFHQLPYREGSN